MIKAPASEPSQTQAGLTLQIGYEPRWATAVNGTDPVSLFDQASIATEGSAAVRHTICNPRSCHVKLRTNITASARPHWPWATMASNRSRVSCGWSQSQIVLRVRRPLAHLSGPPFLPPLRPDQFFPMPILGILPSHPLQFAARKSRDRGRVADWAGRASLSRLRPMAAEGPILTSGLDWGKDSWA